MENISGLFDTHCHIDGTHDNATIVQHARAAGVDRILTVGSDLASSEGALQVAVGHANVWATAGLHPHEAEAFGGDIVPYRELTRDPLVVAVGEIGLDYYYEHSQRDKQISVFRKFLDLSMETGLPAVIHCREAYEDCLQVLRDQLSPGHPFEIHSYTGSLEHAEQFLDMGGFFSFNGMVTFRKARNIREILRIVPTDRILLETDSPYLAPVPHRGSTNEPAYLVHVAAKVAEVKQCSVAEVAQTTTANANRLFL